MWLNIYRIGSIFLIGFSIKLMDDWIDREKNSLALLLGRAALPYTLATATVAIYMSPRDAFPLFAASYAIGMATDLNKKLPIGLYAWQEGALLLMLCVFFTGINITAGSLLTMLAVQVLDDIIDYRTDSMYKRKNVVFTLGHFGAGLVGLVALGGALILTMQLTIYTFIILPIVLGVVKWGGSKF